MAASTKELILKFTGDQRELKAVLAQVRADLAQSARAEVQASEDTANNVRSSAASLLNSQREINRQIEAMWAAREKDQAASSQKQSEVDRAFASQQIATAKAVESEISRAYKNRDSELAKASKQAEDAWTKHEASRLAATRQAEKEGEAAVIAANAAKEKAAKTSSANFLRLQAAAAKTGAATTAQSAASELATLLTSSKAAFDASSLAGKGVDELSRHLNLFVGERIPLAGGAFIRLTDNLRDFVANGGKVEGSVLRLGNAIASIATKTGKPIDEIKNFLTGFSKLETQAEKDEAAIQAFGPALAQQLIPQLRSASTEMSLLSESTAEAGGSIAAIAGPIAIAVLALAAEIAIVAELSKGIFELAKSSADYEGKLLDVSQATGVAVETLSALEVVSLTTGGSVEDLAQSLGIFQRNLQEFAEGGDSKASKALKRLGVDATDTEGALRQTIRALAAMPEGAEQTALALDVFGRSGKAFLAIAKESRGDIDAITKRLKDFGLVTTDEAKLADDFNDQLILLGIQLRGLGKEAIPIVLSLVRDLSRTLKDNRDIFNALQFVIATTAATITVPLKAALGVLREGFALAKPILDGVAATLKAIKEAIEFISGHPLRLPGFGATRSAEEGQAAARKAVDAADEAAENARTKGIRKEIDDRKELQGLLNFILADEKRQAEDRIATAQREFEAGRRTRQQLLEATIDGTQKQTQAEIDALKAERAIKVLQEQEAKHDIDRQQQIGNEIINIDKEIGDKKAAQARNEADLRAKFALDEQHAELAHEQARLDTLTRLGQQRIAVLADQIKRGIVERQLGNEEIEKIENAALFARRDLLKRELELAGVGPDRQVVLDKIKALEADRTELERQQSERRRQIAKEEFNVKRDILESSLDTTLRLEQIAGQRTIDTVHALAAARVMTEEQAARKIQGIRLKLIDDEIEATQAKLKAAGSIADKDERLRTEADLNNQLKILKEQRVTLETETDRAISDAQKKDIENEQHYADDLIRVRQQAYDVERDAAQTLIRLMQIHLGNRRTILRAQLAEDIKAENQRHEQARQTIRDLERDNVESTRTLGEKLAAEIEIDHLREAEKQRHESRLKEIRDQAKKDEALAGPGGGFDFGLNSGQLKEIEGGIRSFQDVAITAFSAVGAVVNGLAQGVGNLVQQWVDLGTTGPNAFRKLVASVLAGVAAQAATLAIMELAYGIAALTPWGAAIYGPAPFHFKAAALFGAVAVTAGLAGRAVAGNSFQQKGASAFGGSGAKSEAQPNNRTLNNSGGVVESSSRAARDGSGGDMLQRLENLQKQNIELQRQQQLHNALVNEALSRLRTARPGDVVTAGAGDARQAIGVAVIDHSNSDGEFNERLQRNLGFGR